MVDIVTPVLKKPILALISAVLTKHITANHGLRWWLHIYAFFASSIIGVWNAKRFKVRPLEEEWYNKMTTEEGGNVLVYSIIALWETPQVGNSLGEYWGWAAVIIVLYFLTYVGIVSFTMSLKLRRLDVAPRED